MASPQPSVAQSASSTVQSLLSGSKKLEPDLITRYNLQSRIASEEKGKQKEEQSPSSARDWTATKESSQETLKRRRDEMILEARRKMMERDAAAPP